MVKVNKEAQALMVLAMQVEQFEGDSKPHMKDCPGRDLEIEVALSQPQFFELPPRYEGAGRNIAKGDPEGEHTTGGINGDINVLRYLIDTDDARTLQPKGWHASTIIQDRWEPHLWFVMLRKSGSGEASAKCNSLAKAWTAAALKAQAFEANREG